MASIIIPFDYDERDSSVIPICIDACDPNGELIARGWIDALVEMADPFRRLARILLGDVWRVSELADESVQDMWTLYRDDLGRKPGARLLVHAKWKALDKRAGGWRRRQGIELDLFEELVETLQDPRNFASLYEKDELLGKLEAALHDLGLEDVNRMLSMMVQGWTPKEIYEHLSMTRHTFTHRFYRGIRKAAESARLFDPRPRGARVLD
jgi:DNA-directed RNA polymerase specialized sigma24 family protein